MQSWAIAAGRRHRRRVKSTAIAREFRCDNFMVAQSSTKPARTAVFDVAKDITEHEGCVP
ncbi:MAG: hypothetical protein ABI624_07490 [Casimicrobiaceae bacterium]